MGVHGEASSRGDGSGVPREMRTPGTRSVPRSPKGQLGALYSPLASLPLDRDFKNASHVRIFCEHVF